MLGQFAALLPALTPMLGQLPLGRVGQGPPAADSSADRAQPKPKAQGHAEARSSPEARGYT
eukprot:3777172-Alexandrium_andersonii.AAC.1